MIGNKIITRQRNPHKVGKHHHGVPHKEAVHGRVSAKKKTHILNRVATDRYGLKELVTSQETPNK